MWKLRERFWILWPWITVLVLCFVVPLTLAHEEDLPENASSVAYLPENASSVAYLHDGDEPIQGVLLTQEQVHGIGKALAAHEERIRLLEDRLIESLELQLELNQSLAAFHVTQPTEGEEQ